MSVYPVILGTAGHIDHGKTSLVKALTGIDTDRLKEEKERGITIELGFAHLDVGGQRLGLVDVPGHERFIKAMVAGAGGVDVVLLTTPPHFRPVHLKAAIDAGKHVFCEKPVAVDAPGVRSVLETTEKAKEKGLAIVSGLCWRYDTAVRETIKRIQEGAIGDIVAIQENYLTGTLWHRDRKPEWSEMEYQLRNWLYYTWLSGDHNVEQHIHSLDKALWLMGDKPPVAATGMGGRQGSQIAVRPGVRADGMAAAGGFPQHLRICDRHPADGKERRLRAMRVERVEHGHRVGAVRSVVERQDNLSILEEIDVLVLLQAESRPASGVDLDHP